MKANTILPWIIVLGAVGGAVFLYAQNQKAEAELVDLRASQTELVSLREEVAELKRLEYAEAELERLRKENVEVHKLRNEVRQLREESRQLAAQVNQQQQQEQPSNSLQQMAFELQRLQEENNNLRTIAMQVKEATTTTEEHLENYKASCIANLRMLDGALEQWALENRKQRGDTPEYEALLAYMTSPPTCPQGGSYTIPAVGKKPTCNMTDHHLP
ncbi:MAG: hypothetical protein ACK4UN_05510 [Limisphaerales bacterium]